MSNEEFVEEILFKSHSLGIYNIVMSEAENIKKDQPRMPQSDIYQLAFKRVANV
jgi:hypothetical protein